MSTRAALVLVSQARPSYMYVQNVTLHPAECTLHCQA